MSSALQSPNIQLTKELAELMHRGENAMYGAYHALFHSTIDHPLCAHRLSSIISALKWYWSFQGEPTCEKEKHIKATMTTALEELRLNIEARAAEATMKISRGTFTQEYQKWYSVANYADMFEYHQIIGQSLFYVKKDKTEEKLQDRDDLTADSRSISLAGTGGEDKCDD